MAERAQTQVKPTAVPVLPGGGSSLQRQCACGTHTLGDRCDSCKGGAGLLQRKAVGRGGYPEVPPIVHDVLRSPGQPLDAATRAFFEPRFGQDFSLVRVHTDARAVASARAVNALAYTVERNVVFGSQQYAPGIERGRKLLAHELAHVAQQARAAPSGALEIGDVNGAAERDADAAANAFSTGGASVRAQRHTSIQLARQEDKTTPSGIPDQNQPAGLTGETPCKPKFKSLEAVTACNIGMRVGDRGCELSLGTPANAGMKFLSQVESSEGCHGTLEYVQLVNFRRERRDKDNQNGCMQGTGALDTSDPKTTKFTGPGTDYFKSADNPGSAVGDDVYHSVDDQFKLWLLWRPRILGGPVNAPPSPRIALATVTWDWKAKTTRTGNSGNCQTDWTISDDDARGGTGTTTSEGDTPSYTQNVADRLFSEGPC